MKIQIVAIICRGLQNFQNRTVFHLSPVRPCCTRRTGPAFCQHAENWIFITNVVFRWRFIHGAIGSAFIMFASLWCPSHIIMSRIKMDSCTWTCKNCLQTSVLFKLGYVMLRVIYLLGLSFANTATSNKRDIVCFHAPGTLIWVTNYKTYNLLRLNK